MRKVIFSKAVIVMIAAVAVLGMSACGSDDNSKTVVESSAETVTEEGSEEVQSSVVELSGENAIAVAEAGFRVIKEMNPEDMIKYTNIELMYYIAGNEKADDEKNLEEITALVNEMDENYNSLGIVGYYATLENIELYDAQPVSVEEIDELNTMWTNGDLSMSGEIQDYQYKIEKAYEIRMSADGVEEGQESYVLVVYVNGQWELDVCLAVLRDSYRMIMGTE